MEQIKFIRKYWLNCVQFLAVFLFTIVARMELPSLSGIVMWFGICFLALLYVACIYEIPIKIGLNQGFGKKRITTEVIIVWIIPLISGYFLYGYLVE
jgi:hypothetical protein